MAFQAEAPTATVPPDYFSQRGVWHCAGRGAVVLAPAFVRLRIQPILTVSPCACARRCTNAAIGRLDAMGACYAQERFSDHAYSFGSDDSISEPLWKYHVCQYPDNKACRLLPRAAVAQH